MAKSMNPYAMPYPFAMDPFALFFRPMPRHPYYGYMCNPYVCHHPHQKHHGYSKPEKLADPRVCSCAEHSKDATGESPKAAYTEAAVATGVAPTAVPAEAQNDPKIALAQPSKPSKPDRALRKGRLGLMRTDVKESEDAFELTINLPGFKKEDVKVKLKDGLLAITAEEADELEEKGQDGTFIRRERYHGSCSRSFFVGEDILEDGISAKFDDGVLAIVVPKDKKALEEKAPTEITID